ncbi:hypothetical protein SERLA73DRAFT_191036 [Serpula lacrymans var. lacrymans S7.3]|uniref:Mitochondrial carrier n=2 Tax=Serpula lacrymans var. lacrymans TaxID=341189 RepID=F8QGU3_SERL3|nr:uncharacterized protein SERLADRAFT_457140 [Serpula lacrymans var. lacrymans S7.9]EGN92526.1 hypothetical protein SERLA73DRAFT_191036 [Serpula lacrymans var. lacrymans S7.3]EGO29427.1 hypothetical protein SERLADRAFT_457140 [Serpula lacrymans var. lacrymans S7.9]
MDTRHGSFPDGHTGDSFPQNRRPADSPTTRALKDIAFGSIAGMVAEVFEYPFDLAKVRLQSQILDNSARFGGPLDCLLKTWSEEGIRGLYRGLPVPIFGSMAETAALFVAYSQIQSLIRWSNNAPQSSELNISQLGLAAGGAGFLTSFILTPIELVKCKMQVQMLAAPMRIPSFHTSPPSFTLTTNPILESHAEQHAVKPTPRNFPGPLAIVSKIIRTAGPKGLWVGHVGTMIRETGGTAAWFASKEFIASLLLARRTYTAPPDRPLQFDMVGATKGSATSLAPWESALSGALAGGICVLALYPADTVKSAMQTVEELQPPDTFTPTGQLRRPHDSFMRTALKMYKAQGWRGLYAGCGMTVARAIPCSGIVFVVYDGLNQRFGL